VKIGANFNVKAYALCVYLELNKALKGLVEELVEKNLSPFGMQR
jgi:hypothetical protein